MVNNLLNLIKIYPNKPWNWANLSRNPSITCEFIKEYINLPWNWDYLSENHSLTCEFIIEFIDKPWDWYFLSYNITFVACQQADSNFFAESRLTPPQADVG